MFFFFIGIAIFGILILFTVLLFYKTSSLSEKSPSENEIIGKEEEKENEEHDYCIPVLHVARLIPGLGKGEVIHYLGSCHLFSLETTQSLEQLELDEDHFTPQLEGEVALTSKTILIFNDDKKKKIYFNSIEEHHFVNSYLLIKRRNVKRKKDIVKIETELIKFKYILHALI